MHGVFRPLTTPWLQAFTQAVATASRLGSRAFEINLMSEKGSQPTSPRYENEVETFGINHVMACYNNPKRNADTELFMRTFKEEIVWPNKFESLEEPHGRSNRSSSSTTKTFQIQYLKD